MNSIFMSNPYQLETVAVIGAAVPYKKYQNPLPNVTLKMLPKNTFSRFTLIQMCIKHFSKRTLGQVNRRFAIALLQVD